jgi:DNA modification methylase
MQASTKGEKMVTQLDFTTQNKRDDLVEIINAFQAAAKADKNIFSLPKKEPQGYAHSLFQYPAMMVPEVQKQIIQLIKQNDSNIKEVLDPYVGAGTSMTASMRCGLNATGQDINPLAVLVSKAKTDLSWSEEKLLESFDNVVVLAKADRSLVVDIDFPNQKKWFKLSVSRELSKLRRAIQKQPSKAIRQVLWVALAETIRLTSNDRTSTYKLHSRPKEEIQSRQLSPIEVFKDIARNYVVDLTKYKETLKSEGLIKNGKYVGKINIILSDTADSIGSDKKFDLIITSPPYGDNLTTITYGQHAYLPLQWIDLKDIDENIDSQILRSTQEIDRRSIGGKPATRDEIEQKLKELSARSINLKHTFDLLKNKPIDRISKVIGFFDDFLVALDKIAASLADHGYMVWTVGNRRVNNIEIPNDQILVDVLKNCNINLIHEETRVIHNKRMPQKNQTSRLMRSEKILIFKKD